MNRRDIIKAIPALLVVPFAVEAWPVYDESLETVRRMASEPHARYWGSRYGRGPTLISFGDETVYEVRFKDDSPVITARGITPSEDADLHWYKKHTSRHIPQELGSIVKEGQYRLRGWVYNGRHSESWVMSVEQISA